MKLSVSLKKQDVEKLDRYVEKRGLSSRSAGLREAIHLLGAPELVDEYVQAFTEWETSGEGAVWDEASGDGLDE